MYEKTKKKIHQMMEHKVFSGACISFITQNETRDFVIGNAQTHPNKEPMTKALLFDVASLTKVICTTTVVLQLMEDGRIDVDQSLSNYLPEFKDKKITIRHLLTHTADITSYIKNRALLNQEELREAYYSVTSGQLLGKKVCYTDCGTILLGFMLEALLKKNVIEIFKERVLLPADMIHSRFLPEDPYQTVPTENHPARGLIRGTTHDPKAYVLAEHAGNAGLFTNLEDTKKFVKILLNKGKINQQENLLKKETVDCLLTDQTPTKQGGRSFGWDLKQDLQGNQILFHTGYTGTFLLIDIHSYEAMIFLSNRVHPVDHRAEYISQRDALIEIYLSEKGKRE